jgi:hypothetical protein
MLSKEMNVNTDSFYVVCKEYRVRKGVQLLRERCKKTESGIKMQQCLDW